MVSHTDATATKYYTYENMSILNAINDFASRITSLVDKPKNGLYDSIQIQLKYTPNNADYMAPLTAEEKAQVRDIKIADYTVALYNGHPVESRRRYLEFNATTLSHHLIFGRLRYLLGIANYDRACMRFDELKSDLEWFRNTYILARPSTAPAPQAPAPPPVPTQATVPVPAPVPQAPAPPATTYSHTRPIANVHLTPFGYSNVIEKTDEELHDTIVKAVDALGYLPVYERLQYLARVDTRQSKTIHSRMIQWMNNYLKLSNPSNITTDDFDSRSVSLSPFGYSKIETKTVVNAHRSLLRAICEYGITRVYRKVKFLAEVDTNGIRRNAYQRDLYWMNETFTA